MLGERGRWPAVCTDSSWAWPGSPPSMCSVHRLRGRLTRTHGLTGFAGDPARCRSRTLVCGADGHDGWTVGRFGAARSSWVGLAGGGRRGGALWSASEAGRPRHLVANVGGRCGPGQGGSLTGPARACADGAGSPANFELGASTSIRASSLCQRQVSSVTPMRSVTQRARPQALSGPSDACDAAARAPRSAADSTWCRAMVAVLSQRPSTAIPVSAATATAVQIVAAPLSAFVVEAAWRLRIRAVAAVRHRVLVLGRPAVRGLCRVPALWLSA